jgi:hypothetical protein
LFNETGAVIQAVAGFVRDGGRPLQRPSRLRLHPENAQVC